MPSLRLLHLSDLHLAAERNKIYYENWNRILFNTDIISVFNNDALEALSNYIHDNSSNIDAILISGDIGVTGEDINMRAALDFFTLPPGSLNSPLLNSKNRPTIYNFINAKPNHIIIMPGNHDNFENIITGSPGGEFRNRFSSFWRNERVQSFFFPDESAPLLAFICCDFSLKQASDKTSRTGHWGQGKAYEDELSVMIDETNKLKECCAVVWVIHFAPNFEIKFSELMGRNQMLIDSDSLITKAEEAGVQIIFCGHSHFGKIYSQGLIKTVNICCAGTSTCVSLNADTMIHIYDIEVVNNRIVSFITEERKYDKLKGFNKEGRRWVPFS